MNIKGLDLQFSLQESADQEPNWESKIPVTKAKNNRSNHPVTDIS